MKAIMNERTQYQQDFLWFSYFGITRSEIGDDNLDLALSRCITRAFRDFSRRLEYTYSSSMLSSMRKGPEKEKAKSFERMKGEFKEAAEKYIANQIERLFKGGWSFDEWHEETCTELMKLAYSQRSEVPLFGEGGFGVGHAQKWINMTLKNMYVMGLWDSGLKEHWGDLHVPIDSYVIEAARNKLVIQKPPWKWSGIIDYVNEYMPYQELIRGKLNGKQAPIEWEGAAWIDQAKKEADKGLRRQNLMGTQ